MQKLNILETWGEVCAPPGPNVGPPLYVMMCLGIWICLFNWILLNCDSFDVLHDSLGLVRTEFPHTVYCVVGTQVSIYAVSVVTWRSFSMLCMWCFDLSASNFISSSVSVRAFQFKVVHFFIWTSETAQYFWFLVLLFWVISDIMDRKRIRFCCRN